MSAASTAGIGMNYRGLRLIELESSLHVVQIAIPDRGALWPLKSYCSMDEARAVVDMIAAAMGRIEAPDLLALLREAQRALNVASHFIDAHENEHLSHEPKLSVERVLRQIIAVQANTENQ